MNYVLQCEKCDKPATVTSTKHGRTINGFETVKKTTNKTCDCGGKIKPTIEQDFE